MFFDKRSCQLRSRNRVINGSCIQALINFVMHFIFFWKMVRYYCRVLSILTSKRFGVLSQPNFPPAFRRFSLYIISLKLFTFPRNLLRRWLQWFQHSAHITAGQWVRGTCQGPDRELALAFPGQVSVQNYDSVRGWYSAPDSSVMRETDGFRCDSYFGYACKAAQIGDNV